MEIIDNDKIVDQKKKDKRKERTKKKKTRTDLSLRLEIGDKLNKENTFLVIAISSV